MQPTGPGAPPPGPRQPENAHDANADGNVERSPARKPAKALGHGAIVTLAITWRGQRREVKTFQDVMTEAEDILTRRDEIKIEPGRFGPKLNFSAFRKTKWSNAAVSSKHWGYQFDRWTSEGPNSYIVAVHKILATEFRDSAKDCDHHDHAKADHVCNAIEILDVSIPKDIASKLTERSMARRKARASVTATTKVAPATPESSPAASEGIRPEGNPQAEIPMQEAIVDLPAPEKGPINHAAKGLGTAAVAELVIRNLPSLRNLATPSVVHISPDGDVFIATDLKGDDAYRMYDLRSRSLGGRRATPSSIVSAAVPTPAAYLSIPRMVGLFQKEGPDGITFTKACNRLGPWKPGEFHRGIEDFGKWQDAYHECFRRDKLRNALREVDLDLHKVTVDGKVQMDEHGDITWTVVPL